LDQSVKISLLDADEDQDQIVGTLSVSLSVVPSPEMGTFVFVRN